MDSRNNRGFVDSAIANQSVVGIVEWFRVGEYEKVESVLLQLQELGITELRTGISWADYFTDAGKDWYDWLIPAIANKVNILPCFLYTPPSIGIRPKTSAPPVNPKEFADFLDVMITKYDQYFEWVELWNNISQYDYTLDNQWKQFCKMIGGAAFWMNKIGKKILLGGMSPVDPNWLQLMYDRGVMKYIDAIGIHGFPNVFDNHWAGWVSLIESVKAVKEANNGQQQIWITEAGFSTWQYDQKAQLKEFIDAVDAPVERMYWYSLNDLNPTVAALEGIRLDDREYHFGMVEKDGTPKLLFRLLKENGSAYIKNEKWLVEPTTRLVRNKRQHTTLITGGAGFIGTNLADALLAEGKSVIVYDNLSRSGVEKNLRWLQSKYKKNLRIQIADIRNEHSLREAVNAADAVYHFAAQVAVTTSCCNPMMDFEVNARGTLNLLEAIRLSEKQPALVFTSTNKVYGGLDDLKVILKGSRYVPENDLVARNGVSENRAIDFHSPYGCSKGAADSYILDYARTFGLKAVIFRMSCIYGPHQFGTEDQGWIAHFLISALEGKPVTIYGDGKQVRDILFVKDLVNALQIAQLRMDALSGEAFNIGGGPKNTISLLELMKIIEDLQHECLDVEFGDWRTGDQKYYVSDINKFRKAGSWSPEISAVQGINTLYQWLMESGNIPLSKYSIT
jgi:CDP-paratose 2-epimerase